LIASERRRNERAARGSPRQRSIIPRWKSFNASRVARRSARAEWARDLGAVRLELAVAENNEAAKALYQGLGFLPTGERRSMASNPARAGIFMARPL